MDAKEIALSNLVFQVASGSTAYGLATEHSDVDRLGAFVPKPEHVFGLQRFDHYRGDEADENYKSLPTFIEHARGGSSFWVETLFVAPQHLLLVTEYFEPFLEHRKLFLTEKLVKKSLGFMEGMVQRSKKQQKLGEYSEKFLAKLEARVPRGEGETNEEYNSRLRQTSELAELEQEELETLRRKQMCHAVRVGRMIVEMYETLDLRVFREDEREHLLGIKQGKVPLEDAYQETEALVAKIEEAKAKITLAEEADAATLNSLIVSGTIKYWWDMTWI